MANRIPFVEIPLNCHERVGESSVTGDFWKTWKLGWRMILLVWEYRLGMRARTRSVYVDDVASSLRRLSGALERQRGAEAVKPEHECPPHLRRPALGVDRSSNEPSMR